MKIKIPTLLFLEDFEQICEFHSSVTQTIPTRDQKGLLRESDPVTMFSTKNKNSYEICAGQTTPASESGRVTRFRLG